MTASFRQHVRTIRPIVRHNSGMSLILALLLTQDPEALKASLKDVDIPASWIYDDIDAGFAEAKKTGKPLLVAFR